MNIRKYTTLAIVIALIIGAVAFLESKKQTQVATYDASSELSVDTDADKAKKYEPAHEISTPDGFINTNGVTVAQHIGKSIVLVDFWTYSCINCQRTLPYLNSWHEKYADQGLVILGIHTPEFDFEKDFDNVQRAVEKFEVEYPVILDNDYSTWRSYKNRYWPRKYLIDIDGYIVYDHIGEGAYDETEKKIVELLNERNAKSGNDMVQQDMSAPDDVDEVDFSKVRTPETYLGYARLEHIANLSSQDCFDTTCQFDIPDEVKLNTYVLDGIWQIGPENAVLKGDSGSITIRFSASKINLVAGAVDGSVKTQIYLDGELIDADQEGADVTNGNVTFDSHDLYNLIDLKGDYSEHLLEIRILESGLSAFAFTFG